VVGLHQNLGRGARPHVADDLLVLSIAAVNVEDEQIGIKRVQVVLGGPD
jgi:hypothetical protein